ncbi:MAG: SemiSWEET family transporter [Candidatus Paceibacterota bacterium]
MPQGQHELSRAKKHTHRFRVVDKLIYVAAIGSPVATLPQVAKVFFEKNGSSIEPITWATFIFLNIFWIFYGALHRDKPIVLTNILWVLVNASMVLGALLYS